jgi:hypothetical protein
MPPRPPPPGYATADIFICFVLPSIHPSFCQSFFSNLIIKINSILFFNNCPFLCPSIILFLVFIQLFLIGKGRLIPNCNHLNRIGISYKHRVILESNRFESESEMPIKNDSNYVGSRLCIPLLVCVAKEQT